MKASRLDRFCKISYKLDVQNTDSGGSCLIKKKERNKMKKKSDERSAAIQRVLRERMEQRREKEEKVSRLPREVGFFLFVLVVLWAPYYHFYQHFPLTFGFLFLAIGLALNFWLISNLDFKVVEAGTKGVRFTWGEPERPVCEPELHPFLKRFQRIDCFNSTIIPLDLEAFIVMSGRGKPGSNDPLERRVYLLCDVDIRIQIIDFIAMVINIGYEDMISALRMQARTTLMDIIMVQSARESIEKWQPIRKEVENELTALIRRENWGVKIVRVNRERLEPADDEVAEAINAVVREQAEKARAEIEASKGVVVRKLQGEAEAAELAAVAKEFDIHGDKEAMIMLLALRDYFGSMVQMASSPSEATRWFIPTEFGPVAGPLAAFADIMSSFKKKQGVGQ